MRWLLVLGSLTAARCVSAQAPFALDTTFRAEFQTWYVSSALPLEDGRVIISGQIHELDEPFPFTFQPVVRLNVDGTWDETFLENTPGGALPGGGKLTPWEDRFYANSTQTVVRLKYDGLVDPTFIPMNNGPYFTSLQGGDYHVFPDGRVVMSGNHTLYDSVRGFEGPHNFIWFSNQGYLDTTRTHRTGNGALYDFIELPDGKFIAGTFGTVYDGRPTSRVQRMHPDGSLDTTFFAGVQWGEAQCFLPAGNDRVYAGGMFGLAANPTDTLHLVRFLPNGDLDPSFNNHLSFELGELDGLGAIVFAMHQLAPDRILLLGKFVSIDGVPHRGLAVVDTSGALIDLGVGTGCGPYVYQNYTYGGFQGAVPYGTDQLLVFGAYHGYDDGVTNDTLQRFVSRLNIGSLYVGEVERPRACTVLAYPNPTNGELVVELSPTANTQHVIALLDALGRKVLETNATGARTLLNLTLLDNGTYQLEVRGGDGRAVVQRVVVQH
ncbi:MAG: T9SS type A sorting domain-containing protein [Flavobacteriales bacterium]|nr:T9SS type A sorting domain-containing protein [Flavobacteriales bacterium]